MNKTITISKGIITVLQINKALSGQECSYPIANQKAMTLAGQSPLITSNYNINTTLV